MNRKFVIVVTLALTAGAVTAYSRVESIFLQTLRQTRSEVRWVPASEQSVDLDGDWMPDNGCLLFSPGESVEGTAVMYCQCSWHAWLQGNCADLFAGVE